MGLVAWTTRYIPRPWLHHIARTAGWCISLFLRGKRYEDPIDGFHYRKLLSYGRIEKRENALAPHCLSLERHRLIWLYLLHELEISEQHYNVLQRLYLVYTMCRQILRVRGLKSIATYRRCPLLPIVSTSFFVTTCLSIYPTIGVRCASFFVFLPPMG